MKKLPDDTGYKGLKEAWNTELVPALEKLTLGLEEMEREIRLMRTVIKTRGTSVEEVATVIPVRQVGQEERKWTPRGDGKTYWLDPNKVLKRRDEVPPEILAQFSSNDDV